MITKYVVYVTEMNPYSNESITFDVEFNSLKEVSKYLGSLPIPSQYYCGHVSKLTMRSGEVNYTDEIVMHF